MLQANFSTSDFRDGLDIAGMMNVSWAKASCHCRSKGGWTTMVFGEFLFGGYHTEMITYLKEFYFKDQKENDEDFPSWCEGKGAKVLRSKLSFWSFFAQKQHAQESPLHWKKNQDLFSIKIHLYLKKREKQFSCFCAAISHGTCLKNWSHVYFWFLNYRKFQIDPRESHLPSFSKFQAEMPEMPEMDEAAGPPVWSTLK